MKNKGLIICFFFFLGTVSLFAQSDEGIHISSTEEDYTDTVSEAKKQEYLMQLKNIPKDTSTHKELSFQNNFQQKYRQDADFDYSRSPGSNTFWKKLKDRIESFLQWLFGWDKNHKIGTATEFAFYILCGIVVLIALYFIVRLIINHKGRWFFQKKEKEVEIDINDLEQLIVYADFPQMIAEAERQGDTRQSIRLYYLWLLRTLKEKNLIEWQAKKTNADYLLEIKDENVRHRFSYLSYLYNYIWYGEFSITDTDYVNARAAFLTHLKPNGNHG